MDIAALLSQIMSDPKIQAVIMGFIVKFAVDWLKKETKTVDSDGNKQYKVPVQLMLVICSGLVSVGDLYLKSQLSTLDPGLLVNFITVTLPVYLSAMGIHLFHQDLKEKLAKHAG